MSKKEVLDSVLTFFLVIATVYQGSLLRRANIDNRATNATAERAAKAAEDNARTAASLLKIQSKQLDENVKLAQAIQALDDLQEKQTVALYRPVLSVSFSITPVETGNIAQVKVTVNNVGDKIAFKPELHYLQRVEDFLPAEPERLIVGSEEILPGKDDSFIVDYRLIYNDWKVGRRAGALRGYILYEDAAEDLKKLPFCFAFLVNSRAFPLMNPNKNPDVVSSDRPDNC